MNAKQYLLRLRQKRRQVLSAKDELDMIRLAAQSITGQAYDKVRVQSSLDPDPLATYMARIEEKQVKLSKLMDEYLDMSLIIREQLAGLLPGLYSDVLYMRYVDGMSLNRISRELNYSYDWIRRIHGRALKEFQRKYLRQ